MDLSSNPLHQAAIATFRPRQEDVTACESVTVTARKEKKQRALVLCVPSETSHTPLAEGACLYVATPSAHGLLKVRMTLRMSRLHDVHHTGMFDAQLAFSGTSIDVSFESHLQRELFVAAAKRIQRDIHSGVTRGEVSAFLTASAEAAANADAEARVHRLRQERQRVFSTVDEARVLTLVRRGLGSFDAIQRVEGALGQLSKRMEVDAAKEILDTQDAWGKVREEIESLNADVQGVQDRLQKYGVHLLGKKAVIQQIESENNTLHRTLQNVEALSLAVHELHDRLNLDNSTVALLKKLAMEQNELVRFFSNREDSRRISKAMKQMEGVLHDESIDVDFPLLAVRQQKKEFLKHRKMIVGKATLYALSIIEIFKDHYLSVDAARFSGNGRLVWRLHGELIQKLEDIAEILTALERIDMEGFAAVLRKYRASMQQVYTIEIRRFFAEARLQVKKVGVMGQPMLGERDSAEASLRHMMETGMMGDTPGAAAELNSFLRNGLLMGLGSSGGSGGRPSANYFTSPIPLPPQTQQQQGGLSSRFAVGSQSPASYRCGVDPGPSKVAALRRSLSIGGKSRNNHSDDDDDSDRDSEHRGKSRTNQSKAGPAALYVEVPELNLSKIRLQREGQLTNMTLYAASAATAFTHRVDPFGSGCVRPDVMFAIAVETTLDCILREEAILARCFGLKYEAPPDNEDDAMGGDATTLSSAPSRRQQDKEKQRLERNEQLHQSLRELFAGDAVLSLREHQLPPRAPQRGDHRRRSMRRNDDDDDEDSDDARSKGGESSSSNSDDEAQKKALREAAKRNFIKFELVELAQFLVDRCDRLYILPMLCMVRALQRKELPSAQSPYCLDILVTLETSVLAPGLATYVSEQTDSIERCGRKWMLRPHALLHCFAKLPLILRRLEATLSSLNPDVLDTRDYASVLTSLTDQAFSWLDVISCIRKPNQSGLTSAGGGMGGDVVTVADLITEKIRDVMGLSNDAGSPEMIRKGFLTQYRHHAFFCAVLQTFPEGSLARTLFAERFESSMAKRERYEELYLTRLLLMDHFPKFAHFMVTAEDLQRTYSLEELGHHRALSAESVAELLGGLVDELHRGIPAAAARMKRHFTRDVRPNTPEEGFHAALLHVTWQHFSDMVKIKVRTLDQMLKSWPHLREAQSLKGLKMPCDVELVSQLLKDVAQGKAAGRRDGSQSRSERRPVSGSPADTDDED